MHIIVIESIVVYHQVDTRKSSTRQNTTRGQRSNKDVEKVSQTSSLRTEGGTGTEQGVGVLVDSRGGLVEEVEERWKWKKKKQGARSKFEGSRGKGR